MARIIGKFPINPFLFLSGKGTGFLIWVIAILHPLKFGHLVFYTGAAISIFSIINLGKSTSLGIPVEKTVFKTNGLYKYSRNPIYLGTNLMTLSTIIITHSTFCWIV